MNNSAFGIGSEYDVKFEKIYSYENNHEYCYSIKLKTTINGKEYSSTDFYSIDSEYIRKYYDISFEKNRNTEQFLICKNGTLNKETKPNTEVVQPAAPELSVTERQPEGEPAAPELSVTEKPVEVPEGESQVQPAPAPAPAPAQEQEQEQEVKSGTETEVKESEAEAAENTVVEQGPGPVIQEQATPVVKEQQEVQPEDNVEVQREDNVEGQPVADRTDSAQEDVVKKQAQVKETEQPAEGNTVVEQGPAGKEQQVPAGTEQKGPVGKEQGPAGTEQQVPLVEAKPVKTIEDVNNTLKSYSDLYDKLKNVLTIIQGYDIYKELTKNQLINMLNGLKSYEDKPDLKNHRDFLVKLVGDVSDTINKFYNFNDEVKLSIPTSYDEITSLNTAKKANLLNIIIDLVRNNFVDPNEEVITRRNLRKNSINNNESKRNLINQPSSSMRNIKKIFTTNTNFDYGQQNTNKGGKLLQNNIKNKTTKLRRRPIHTKKPKKTPKKNTTI